MNSMTVQQWIDSAMRGGNVCNDYMRKWKASETKAEKFRVICDVNGGEWLFNLDNKGVQLPIDAFTEEYANFINGKQIVYYPHGYTSKMYCRYVGTEDIVADTTIVYMLDCQDACLRVPSYSYPSILLSKTCKNIRIIAEKDARLNLTVFGNAECQLEGDTSNVKIENR